MRVVHVVMVLTVLVAACSDRNRDIRNTVFAPQVKALEKARSVEDTLTRGAEKDRKAIESFERADVTENR